MSIPCDSGALRTIEALVSIERQLDAALTGLADASARSAGLADQTAWRTDAATMFHAAADAWNMEVAGLAGGVEAARDDVGRVRAKLEALAWEYPR